MCVGILKWIDWHWSEFLLSFIHLCLINPLLVNSAYACVFKYIYIYILQNTNKRDASQKFVFWGLC